MTFCSFVVIFSCYLLFIAKLVSRCHTEVPTKQGVRCKQFTSGFVHRIGILFTLIFAEPTESPVSCVLFSVWVLYKFCMFCMSSGETKKSSTKLIFADSQNGKAYQTSFQWNFRNHVRCSYLIHFSTIIIFVLPLYLFSSFQLINVLMLMLYLFIS